MSLRTSIGPVAVAIAFLALGPTLAAAQETVRGQQLMTEQERLQQRLEMRNATTDAEREAIRQRQQEEMEKRAQEQGVKLQHESGPAGRALGTGQGQGQGLGRGQGRGPGGGR